MYGSSCIMNVLVNGRAVKEYLHEGLTFIEAKNGTEFTVEVKNNSYRRVLAIVSVDGLDVVDGKPAESMSRGYVIDGWSSVKIKGWRKSESEVGAFKFTSSKKSYAASKGLGQNNGVIAVRVIQEKEPTLQWSSLPPVYKSAEPCPEHVYYSTCANMPARDLASCSLLRSASTTASTTMSAKSFDTGTTWGTRLDDKITTTEFERGAEVCTMSIYYASRESLKEMGVPFQIEQKISTFPQAFKDSFATPPKDWK